MSGFTERLPNGEVVDTPLGKARYVAVVGVMSTGLVYKFSEAKEPVPVADILWPLSVIIIAAYLWGASAGKGRPMLPWVQPKI